MVIRPSLSEEFRYIEESYGDSLEPIREFADRYDLLIEIPGFAALGLIFGKYTSHAIMTLNSLKAKVRKSDRVTELKQVRNESKSYNYAAIGTVIGGLIGLLRNLDL